jgi:hypothetical protein
VLTLIAALSFAAPAPKDKVLDGPFFPTKVGAEWTTEDDMGETTFVVNKVEKDKDGSLLVSVGRRTPDRVAPLHTMRVTDRGLEKAHGPNGEKSNEPYLYLSPSREWRTFGETRTAAGVEEVSVPAGRFKCLRVEVASIQWYGPHKRTEWYAPGVGRVKVVTTEGGTPGYVQVLKRFSPGN